MLFWLYYKIYKTEVHYTVLLISIQIRVRFTLISIWKLKGQAFWGKVSKVIEKSD